MKKLLIAGNWKSNKDTREAIEWLHAFKSQISNLNDQFKKITIVLYAPFTLLYPMKREIDRLKIPLELGAQDVSPFSDGAYTGEVNARQIKELADWVIIGHSERRINFGETDERLKKKVARAKGSNLQVIFCIPDDTTAVPPGVDVVAYEPVWAIGTGKSDTPQNANHVMSGITANTRLYGGSVTAENVAAFVAQPAIDGVLVGGASLDPEKFAHLILCNQK